MNDDAKHDTSRVAASRERATGHADVPVWDWPVRFVHWAIVLLLAALLVTGKAGGDWLAWHMRAGETLLALALFRVLWGVVGSRHARFASFVRGPREVAAYARSLLRPPHATFAGHNPLGGWMVVLLLAALLVQAALGLFTNDDIMNEGPLVRHVSKDLSDQLSSLHRRNAWIVIGLASVHIVAVLGYLVAFRDNLITPMLTGRKRLEPQRQAEAAGATANRRAVALLLACGIAVWLLVRR
ncbi:MAG TPA: cytochrome b/b6 domain-containing protein [Casimicrobiaceae bacterium]|nr:cytochrome b/b6 domain-containing protein [Casimicrobiaceae bacterium]